MIPLILLAVCAGSFLVFLIFQVRSRYSKSVAPAAGTTLIPVDLEAFENLTDPNEEEYLRMNLSSAEFRLVQRSRIHAARMYVSALSENATRLVAVAQSARFHSSADAASAQEIIQQAIRLKVWCLLAECRLIAALALPGFLSPSNAIVRRYQAVTSLAAHLPHSIAA